MSLLLETWQVLCLKDHQRSKLPTKSLTLGAYVINKVHEFILQHRRKICGIKGLEHYRDDSPNPCLDDGFTWRKYGQKAIKTSLYQRLVN